MYIEGEMTGEVQVRMSTFTLGTMELETDKSTAAPNDDDSSKRKGIPFFYS